MASKKNLEDHEIEYLLFLRPPEGSKDELEDVNLDELVYENIFVPNNNLDSTDLPNPILIVLPNSNSLTLRQPLGNSTATGEVSIEHTPIVNKTNTSKRQIKSVIWKKRPFQIGQPGHDRLFRIRTVLETLKKRFQTVTLEESLSVDEQLCATKGRHFMKQYMPMKPHKWGYKLFILAGVSGASANLVVRLCRIIPTDKNYVVYFDNYYTSLGLLVYLKNIGILSLRAVRRNRLKQVKLPNEKEFMKSIRGSSVECITKIQNNIISAVVWKDNRLVTLLSTFVGEQPKTEVLRFSKSQKKSLNIPCPSAVTVYNKHMGGVDLLDANIGRYKILKYT
ncbi:piggyBac transposable element-derived protein 3-like [Melanaphis sacchari]|uniref:piggyBac transposable element-derived protein 3-like n=1 Tax=Melanaphis sacchari TaxID=742174 RepID=UPI000DC13282|nr:piggyBac transposable element-derived protein 3-like [Melanaphis sacchari]